MLQRMRRRIYFKEMKTESGRKYLWSGAERFDTKSADMTRTYRNIEKIAEEMKHKILLNNRRKQEESERCP